MHELSLAHEVIQVLTEEAARHRIARIARYRLEVGLLRGVVPELLRSGLELAGRGTAAEGAAIELLEVAGRARCPSCGHEFSIPDLLILCPSCARVGGDVLAGSELRVIELEGD